MNVAGRRLRATAIFKGLGVLLFMSLVLPFYTAVYNRPMDLRLPQPIMGFHGAFYRGYVSLSNVLLILIPIVLFVLFHCKRGIERTMPAVKGRFYTIAAGLSALGLLFLFLAMLELYVPQAVIRPAIGFALSAVLYGVVAALATGFAVAGRRR